MLSFARQPPCLPLATTAMQLSPWSLRLVPFTSCHAWIAFSGTAVPPARQRPGGAEIAQHALTGSYASVSKQSQLQPQQVLPHLCLRLRLALWLHLRLRLM